MFTPGLVSVVIPAYNQAHTLARAIDSVLNQTYSNIEVVVVDDGSTDGTTWLMATYDRRVRHLRQQHAGMSAARNTGLAAAKGEFIALLDADAEWLAWKAELQVRLLRAHPLVGMVATDVLATDSKGRIVEGVPLRDRYAAYSRADLSAGLRTSGSIADVWPGAPARLASQPFRCGDLFPAMFLGNLIHTSTVMLRRERFDHVKGFDPSLKASGADYDFHLRTCREGDVGLIDVSGAICRVDASDGRPGPEQMLQRATDNLEMLERCLARDRARVTLSAETIRRHMADAYCWLGEVELWAGEHRKARGHLLTGLSFAPFRLRTLTCLAASLGPPPMFRQGLRLLRAMRGTAPATG